MTRKIEKHFLGAMSTIERDRIPTEALSPSDLIFNMDDEEIQVWTGTVWQSYIPRGSRIRSFVGTITIAGNDWASIVLPWDAWRTLVGVYQKRNYLDPTIPDVVLNQWDEDGMNVMKSTPIPGSNPPQTKEVRIYNKSATAKTFVYNYM